MYTKNKERLCWNCEGAVTRDAIFCPFCGSNVATQESPEDEEQLLAKLSQHKSQKLTSLYKPPYTPSQHSFGLQYSEHDMFEEEPGKFFEEPKMKSSSFNSSEGTEISTSVGGVWPIFFMSLGMNLLTLGLLLFFFSERGKLTLEWNSHYWFVYCVIALPILIFGWKLLKQQKTIDSCK